MKPKKATLILQSLDDIKKEWASALKGKVKSAAGDNVIVVTSLETIAKIFSKPRMEILQAIIAKKPQSIYELAKIVDRDFKNVYSDVQFLNDVGLIKLKETGDNRKGLKPIAKYSGVEFDLAA
jgi:predicted transcriptional regulator